MKPTSIFWAAFGLALTIQAQEESDAPRQRKVSSAMREPASHASLSQNLRMAQQNDPIRELGPAIGEVDTDPSKRTPNRDLIAESTILCYRGCLTLVPKRAVLHLPENLKDRFHAKDNVNVQTWLEFYAGNRGWIRTIEVTREQAMGQAPLNEEIVKAFEQSTSVVVAVFKGGPISVLPYVEPTPAEGETSAAVGANDPTNKENP